MHVIAQRLDGSHRDIHAQLARRRDHAKADGVNARDGFGANAGGNGGQFGRTGFKAAQIGRVLIIDRGGVRVGQRGHGRMIEAPSGIARRRHQFQSHRRIGAVGIAGDHRQPFGADRRRQDDAVAPR